MLVRFGTTQYTWSEKLSMRMAVQLKRDRQVTPKGFILGMEELDPASIDALHYIVRVEAGEDGRQVPRLSDDFDFFSDFELMIPPEDEDPTGPASPEQPDQPATAPAELDRAERVHEILTAAVTTSTPASPTPTPPVAVPPVAA
jgi:hypothetical protein